MTWLQSLFHEKKTAYHATIADKASLIFRDGCILPDMPTIEKKPMSYIKASEPGCIYGWNTAFEASVHAKHLTEASFPSHYGIRGRDPVIIPFRIRTNRMFSDSDSWGVRIHGKAVELSDPIYPFRTVFEPYPGALLDVKEIEQLLESRYSLHADLGAYIQGPCFLQKDEHDLISRGAISLYGSTRVLMHDNMATFGITTGHRRLETTYCFPEEQGMEKAALSSLCSLLDLLAEEKAGNVRKDNCRRV